MLDLDKPYRTRDGRRAEVIRGPNGCLYGWATSPGGGSADAEYWDENGVYDRAKGTSSWDLVNVSMQEELDAILNAPEPDVTVNADGSVSARRTVPDALENIAAIYRDRNGTYGDNYLHAGEVLLGLFPRGLTLRTADEFNRFHLIVHLLSKISRYCMTMQLAGRGHADSLDDLSVYAQMLNEFDALAAGQR